MNPHPHMVAGIMDMAEKINAACDALNLSPDSAIRYRSHRLHGELIAHGADSAEEVLRIVMDKAARDAQELPA